MHALGAIARLLGAWTAVSLLALPALVVCVRIQARLNARLTGRLQRDAWTEARRA